MPKMWSECSKAEHDECRLFNRKIKWMKNGYEWGLITWVDYCHIQELLGKELDDIERKYESEPQYYEEQYTLF